MTPSNQAGSALLEAAPVMLMLTTFIAGLMVVTYLLFAQVWLRYQTEQSLFCLAEDRAKQICRREMENRLVRFLPWGQVRSLRLSRSSEDWRMEVKWEFNTYQIQFSRSLSLRNMVQRRVLSW